ncbi:MAG: phosphotransferase [Proteobacteria bacterium]|nr:phosphotransferase [Pseudomonadota bacterium]
MLHPELEEEKEQNYPTVKKMLVGNYGQVIGDIGDATIRAEESGNQGYGFHVTLPGSESPDFFFKIEKQLQERQPQEEKRLGEVREFMESLHNAARESEKSGKQPSLDSAKFIRDNSKGLIGALSGEGMPEGLVGHEISLQTNLGASKLPLREDMLEKRENISYDEQKENPDPKFERSTRQAIDVNPSNFPSYIVAEMAGTLGKLHNAGQDREFTSSNAEFNELVGDGSVFRQKFEEFSRISSPTKSQSKVIELMGRLAEEKESGKLEAFTDVLDDFDKLPQTRAVHHDAHPLNFLQKESEQKEMAIPGEEQIVPIDMEDLSIGPRIEDLALLIGQTKIDHNALRPHEDINPMGKNIDQETATTILRGYEEVASPLTEAEIKHMFNFNAGSRARDQLAKIAQITPEQFEANKFDSLALYRGGTFDKAVSFSLEKPLAVFEESKENDLVPLITKARKQIRDSQQNLDGLDLEIKPGQLGRIGQKETSYGKAASSPTSKDGVPGLDQESMGELNEIKGGLQDFMEKEPKEKNHTHKMADLNLRSSGGSREI